MNRLHPCKNSQSLLAAFADNALSPSETEPVAAHLSGCAVCQSIVDDFRATARLVSTLPAPPALSADFAAKLARRIADESLAPKPLSPLDKARAWWDETMATAPTGYRFAPAFAGTLVAALVLVPTGYLLRGTTSRVAQIAPSPIAPARVATTASVVASDPTLTELWNEHTAFAATQALGDPAQPLASDPPVEN